MSVTDQEYAEYENWAKEQKVNKYRAWKAEQKAEQQASKFVGVVVLIIIGAIIVLGILGGLLDDSGKNNYTDNDQSNDLKTMINFKGTYTSGYIGNGESVIYKIELDSGNNYTGTFSGSSINNGIISTNFDRPFTYTITGNKFQANFKDNSSLATLSGMWNDSGDLQITTRIDNKIPNLTFVKIVIDSQNATRFYHITTYAGSYRSGLFTDIFTDRYGIDLKYDNKSNTGIFRQEIGDYNTKTGEYVVNKVNLWNFTYTIINDKFEINFQDNCPVKTLFGNLKYFRGNFSGLEIKLPVSLTGQTKDRNYTFSFYYS